MSDMKTFYEVQMLLSSTIVHHLKGIVVLPPSLFLFLFFLLFLYFCGLIGSFYLSLICPLWDLLICPLLGSLILSSLGSFPHLRATLYILQEYKEDLSHFTRSTQHKENRKTIMIYANVCLCQC